jgi:transcriptional regulator with XRE-family HTH domain
MGEDEPKKGEQPHASNLLLVLLCQDCGWNQAQAAAASGVAASQISVYYQGDRAVPPHVLEKIAAAADFPADLLEPAERAIRSFQAARRGRRRQGRAAVDAARAELLALLDQAADLVLSPLRAAAPTRPRPAPADREEGADLARRLARSSPAERELLLEEGEEYWSWAVAEQLGAESLILAPNEPREALEVAKLGLRIAERVPGEESFRWRLTGHALAYLTNARRVCGEL